MNDIQPTNESRNQPMRSSAIRGYIAKFSSTEKAIFGILVLALLVSALAMAGRVNGYFLTEIPAHGGTLREGIVGLPRTINPVLAVTDVDRDLAALIYSGLMKYVDGTFVPDLAESYKVSDDGLVYTFMLRDKLRFQDGKPLTIDDVIFTIQKIQDANLKSPRRADWLNVSVAQSAPRTITFTLKQPYSPFLSNTTVGIIPKHIWGPITDEQFIFNQYNTEPIGSGPYKVAAVTKDSKDIPAEYTLTTWSGYYATTPYISTLSFTFFADETNAVEALEGGTIDSLPAISAGPAAKLKGEVAGDYQVLSTPLPRVFGVFLNQNQNQTLADKTIRRALDLSLDRTAIVNSVLNGYGMPLTGPLPFTIGTSTTGVVMAKTASSTTGMNAAMALLEKDGWVINADGFYEKKGKSSTQTISFTLYTADTPDLKRTADLVKDTWTRLGVHVELKVFEPSDLYQNVIRPRKYDALLFGEQIGKDRDLYAFWHSSQRNAPGLNVALYTNSKADQLLEDIRATSNPTVRATKYAEFEEIVRNDLPAIFLFSPHFIYVVPANVHDVNLGTVAVSSDRWNSIDEWYIATEKVWRIFDRN